MTSVLDPQHHARLIADMEHVTETANIPRVFVETPMSVHCSQAEIDWLLGYPDHVKNGVAGLVLVGVPHPDTRLMTMTGAFLRQFINAQLHSLNSLLDEKRTPPDPTVLLIPNLFVRAYGKSLPAWKIQSIYDLLLSRYTAGKLTVCYVESMEGLGDSYGMVFADHLNAHYTRVTA